MNKKFSTLVAGLLLTTSFGAFAADELQVLQKDFKSGSTYFLTTSDDVDAKTQALVVKGAELQMVKWKAATNAVTEIEEMTKAEREYAMWTVTSKKITNNVYSYEFTNKATGQKLQVSAAAPGVAFTANGVSQFEWATIVAGTNTAITVSALTNATGANTVQLQQAFVVGDAGLTGATGTKVDFSQLLPTEGKNQTRLMENIADADRTIAGTQGTSTVTAANLAVTQGAATIQQITDAKAIVTAFDALLTSLKIDVAKATYLADYKDWATAVKAVSIPSSGTVDLDASDVYTKLTDAKADIAKLVANDYGWTVKESATAISGVVYDADGDGILSNNVVYAKGTIFVTDLEVLPALMPEAELNSTSSTLVEDDKVYVDAFALEFNKGSQEAKDVVAVLGFDGPVAETNVLANADIQIVQRNLLKVDNNGLVTNADALTDGDFQATTVIFDKKSKKYLVIKPETYETGNTGTYHKLAWADLDDYKAKDMTMVDGTTYSRAKGNLTAAYMFNVKYNMNNDSLTIMPAFNISKVATTSATDTVGTSYTMAANSTLVASLKEFSKAVEMTTLDPATQRAYRINTGATSTGSGWEITSKPSDVYFIQYISAKADNEKFFTADGLVKGSVEALNDLPYAQWALVKDVSGLVTIKNRATNKVFNELKDAQLYKAGGELVSVYKGDTLKLTSVDKKYKMDSTLGSFAYDLKKNEVLKYKLTYFNELDATKNVSYTKDSIMFVDKAGEGMWFQVVPVPNKTAAYGADAIKDISKKLVKSQYRMFTKINGKQYNVVYDNTNDKFEISAATSNKVAAIFEIKEMMHADKHWSVLINPNSNEAWDKVSVNDNTLELFGEDDSEKRTSMFALTHDDAPKYRRFGETIVDNIAKNDTAYVEFFKADEPTRFLFENTRNKVAGNGTSISKDSLNFLGMYNKADFTVNASIFVDTAYVRNDTIKPLYMLAMDAIHVPSSAIPCPVDGSLNCPHHKDMSRAYTTGRYLVALNDSVEGNASAKYQENVRLAFVPAKHINDTLVINNSIYTGVKGKTANDSLIVKGDNMTAATFAFRLVNDDPADFYIESANDMYVRIHNGIPVLINNIEDAALFNVGGTIVRPTDNETIGTTVVSVIAGNGQVVINNAAGKTVAISNILGQTIAQTVLTSDNATISVPAGIVVVAVEGEKAVKAIIK